MAGSATKSLGQCGRICIKLNFLQNVADIEDTWLHSQPSSTSSSSSSSTSSQNSFEDVELPVRVETRRCSHGLYLFCKLRDHLQIPTSPEKSRLMTCKPANISTCCSACLCFHFERSGFEGKIDSAGGHVNSKSSVMFLGYFG